MGDNSLVRHTTGTPVTVDSAINQYKIALSDNNIPRNADGVIENEAGELGNATYKWLEAFVRTGYFNAGDIKAHHTYNGITSIGQGWFPCNGQIISEIRYDAVHGAGSWAEYIGTSPLEGKYSPFIGNKYLTGTSSTTQDGTLNPFTSVGNIGHTIDTVHSHTVNAHTHAVMAQWVGGDYVIVVDSFSLPDSLFNYDGSYKTPMSSSQIFEGVCYGSRVAQGTGDAGTTAQDIQPESIEVIYYIRII